MLVILRYHHRLSRDLDTGWQPIMLTPCLFWNVPEGSAHTRGRRHGGGFRQRCREQELAAAERAVPGAEQPSSTCFAVIDRGKPMDSRSTELVSQIQAFVIPVQDRRHGICIILSLASPFWVVASSSSSLFSVHGTIFCATVSRVYSSGDCSGSGRLTLHYIYHELWVVCGSPRVQKVSRTTWAPNDGRPRETIVHLFLHTLRACSVGGLGLLLGQATRSSIRPPKMDAWDCCLGQVAFPGSDPNRLCMHHYGPVWFVPAKRHLALAAIPKCPIWGWMVLPSQPRPRWQPNKPSVGACILNQR
jgi:hypothetical protein